MKRPTITEQLQSLEEFAFKQKISELKSEVAVWKRHAAEADKRLGVAVALSKHAKPAKSVAAKASRASESVAFLIGSDWHVEETVDPATCNGLNRYNLDVADARIQTFFASGLKLINIQRTATDIDTCVLGLLGDHMTGYIHEELIEGNSMSPTETILWLKPRIQRGIDALRKQFKRVAVICCQGNHGRCHDDQTELLTREGWKQYDQLRVGEMVATYRMGDERNEWQPLKEVYVAPYDGEMIHVTHASADFMVTPAHRMVLRNDRSKISRFVEMQNLTRETVGGGWFPKYALGKTEDLPGVTDDQLTLLGWIMTDGSYSKSRGKTSISIYQSKEAGVMAIATLLNRMGINCGVFTRHRPPPVIKGVQCKTSLMETRFGIYAKHAPEILALLPDRKTIPDWFYNLSQRQVEVLLAAIIAGDGAVTDGKYLEIHKTEEFLSQLQSLLIVNGKKARLRINGRGDAVLGVSGTRRGYINNWEESVKRVPYKGTIWCGTVENGTLITRRNGIPLISGNTTQKMRIATAYKNSFEWLMYHTLADLYQGTNAEFQISNSYHNFFEVYGRTIRFHHGDAIRYGGGVGGITIPVHKAISQWNKSRTAYLDVFGHWHQELDGGSFIANGSLIGYGPYALSIKASPEPPQQACFLIEKTRGKTIVAPVFV